MKEFPRDDYNPILDEIGEFSWTFGQLFFVETPRGNWIWSDPDYNGDNTLRPYNGSLDSFLKETGVPFVRDKGKHLIRNYCGSDVKVC